LDASGIDDIFQSQPLWTATVIPIFGSRAAPDPNEQLRLGISAQRAQSARDRGLAAHGNENEIERLRIGPHELPSIEVDEAIVKLFAQVSGDRNPYHLDSEYARTSRYQAQIGHGILTVALAISELSRVLPSYIPDEIEIARFTAPVHFGDRVRVIILGAERERSRWRLSFVVTNQEDVEILQGSMCLWGRIPEDGPTSWLEILTSSFGELQDESHEWSKSVQAFPVRPAPHLQSGQISDFDSTISEDRLKANIVISGNSSWITALFSLEAVAQASAEVAPGFILVGAEVSEFSRPFQIGEPLVTRATVTRQGTLAHRPTDRIRIDMTVLDEQGDILCRGAVYKESEGPIPESIAVTAENLNPGVEFLVPPIPRLLSALSRLHQQPFLSVLSLDQGMKPDEIESTIESTRDAIIQHLNETSFGVHHSTARGYVFLRIHSLRTPWAAADLLQLIGQAGHLLDGVIIPDVVHPEDIQLADRILTGLEEAQNWEIGRLKIEAMIQTPEIARRSEELAEASSRIVGLINALGAHLATPELGMIILRATQGSGIDIIDGTTRPTDDGRETALGAVRSGMLGFQRKWAFNPIQLNAILNPKLYLSEKDMELAAISREGIRHALSHDPGNPSLWQGTRINRQPRTPAEVGMPYAELEEFARTNTPLLS
jgi:acyl dehydratase/citrate lyase beta subunit